MFLVLHGLAKGFNGSLQAYIILILHLWDFVISHGGHGGEIEPIRSVGKGGYWAASNWSI